MQQTRDHFQLGFVVLAALIQRTLQLHLFGNVEHRHQHMGNFRNIIVIFLVGASETELQMFGEESTAVAGNIDFHIIERIKVTNELFFYFFVKQ